MMSSASPLITTPQLQPPPSSSSSAAAAAAAKNNVNREKKDKKLPIDKNRNKVKRTENEREKAEKVMRGDVAPFEIFTGES